MRRPASLVLASRSPRRKLLLEEAGIIFETEPAPVEEWDAVDADPVELVRHNAAIKAEFVALRRPDQWVLGSDTTVALDGHVLNKPANMDEAREMLKRLGGNTHRVFTAVDIRNRSQGLVEAFVECSAVTFKPLEDTVIDSYFVIVDPLDKAGAYGIQEGRDLIIERFEGYLSTIMGLPIERVLESFERLRILEDLRPSSG